jgi:type IV secretion system protein VirD4
MYRQVQPYSPWQQLERFAWFWGTMATLAWAAFGMMNASVRAVDAILEAGWGRTLGASEPLAVLSACALNASCAPNLELIPRAYDRVLYLAPFFSLVALGLGVQVFKRYPAYKAVAAGRWATRAELRKYLEPASSLVGYLGLVVTRSWLPRALWSYRALGVPEDEWSEHALVFGPPGSGKTVGFFRPVLFSEARAGRSAVVFDVKHGDQRQGLGAVVNEFRALGRRVEVFAPYAQHSRSLDLFQGCESLEKATQAASVFVPIPAIRGESAFYEDQERMLLAAMIVDGKLKSGVRLDQIRIRLKSGVAPLKNYIQLNPHLEAELGTLLGFSADRLTGIMNGLAAKLEPFSRGRLPLRLAGFGSSIKLERVFQEPTLFYVGIPQADVYSGHGALLMQLVYRTLNEAGLRVADAHGGQVPIGTSVCLDELLNLGRLEGLQNMLATLRSRGIAYLLGVQSHDEGRAKYTRDTWEAVVKLCRHKIFFTGALDPKDALETSKLLGEMTVFEQSVVHSDSDQGDRRGTTTREARRALMSQEEMLASPPFHAVVLSRYLPPFQAAFYPLFDPRHPDHTVHAQLIDIASKLPPLEFPDETTLPNATAEIDAQSWLEIARTIVTAVKELWNCKLFRQGKRIVRVRFGLEDAPKLIPKMATWNGTILEIPDPDRIAEEFVNALVWLQRYDAISVWMEQNGKSLKGSGAYVNAPIGELEGTTLWMPAEAVAAVLGKAYLQRKQIVKRVVDGVELEVAEVSLSLNTERLERRIKAMEAALQKPEEKP